MQTDTNELLRALAEIRDLANGSILASRTEAIHLQYRIIFITEALMRHARPEQRAPMDACTTK